MEAFTAGTEGIEGKYKDMVIGFKKDAEGMQTHASTAVEDMRKSVQGNFDLLNKEYGKALEEVKAQMIKANVDLILSFSKNFEGLKTNLKNIYEDIQKSANANLEMNVKKFREMCEDITSKIPVLPAKLYLDLIKFLDESQKKCNGNWEKAYLEFVPQLETSFQQAVKNYTLPLAEKAVAAALGKQGPPAAPAKPTGPPPGPSTNKKPGGGGPPPPAQAQQAQAPAKPAPPSNQNPGPAPKKK